MPAKIALVTGGMGGIGQAICQLLYTQEIRVIASYHRGGHHELAQAWKTEQEKAGYRFDIAYVDVADFHSCEKMVKQAENDIGPIDILINNAGITHDISCCKMTKDDWDIIIQTDLNSVFYVTRHVINGMKDRQYGRIINISSINGQKGQYGQVNYSAAKAGIHGFTKSLALEVAKHGITVNTISPGYVATEMVMAIPDKVKDKILAEIPMGRFAHPAEIARVVVFLSHEENGYITGANIAINGGHYML